MSESKKMHRLTLVDKEYEIVDAKARDDIDALNKNLSGYQPKGDYALKTDIPTNYATKTDLATLETAIGQIDPGGTAETKVTEHNDSTTAHNDIRTKIQELADSFSDYQPKGDYATNESVDNKIAGIKIPNVPTKLSEFTNDSGFITSVDVPNVPTKLSEFTNDSGYIKSSDLDPYALKTDIPTDYATKTELETLQTTVDDMDPESAARALITSHDTSTSAHNDIRRNLDDLNSAINNCQPAGNYATIEYVNQKLTDLDVSEVPTKLSDLSDDENHRLVTDTEKVNWNSKADVSAIPTALSSLTDDSTHRLVTDAEKSYWNKKAEVSDIPTLVEDLADGSKYAKTSDIPTDTINFTCDRIKEMGVSVKALGAMGDGVTDDTAVFQDALASGRVVRVPGGTYKLSKTIVIQENSCLELSQNTLLDFTQTSGNCIEMRGSAVLRGNHGNVNVSSSFTGNVVSVDTAGDGVVHGSIDPYGNWTPLWQRQRFIYDLNITRTDGAFRGSLNGDYSGTALYISANYDTEETYDGVNTAPITCIWGMTVSGLRIGGAFEYGIDIQNRDKTESGYGNSSDPAWNHDMRIEAVIHGCATGVRAFNCNYAHLDVTVEPASSINKVNGAYVKYAKNGIVLEHCTHMDLSQSHVWDWDSNGTLVAEDERNSHIALIGSCKCVILSDNMYYEKASTVADVRDIIYTDTPSNFDSLIILQEPFTRWFKPVDSEPYFFDGDANRRLAYKEEVDQYFQADRVLGYTDALANAIDTDGTIYNGVGYSKSGGTISGSGTVNTAQAGYYGHTGFIACPEGATVYVEGLKLSTDGDVRVAAYDSNFNLLENRIATASVLKQTGGAYFFPGYTETETGFSFRVTTYLTCAYIRIGFLTKDLGNNPTIAVNEEIKYDINGFLVDGIKVNGSNLVLYSPDGIAYGLSVSSSGTLSVSKLVT